MNNLHDDDHHNHNHSHYLPKPFTFQVCNGILYDVKFVSKNDTSTNLSSSSSLLITCGENGVFIFHWNDIRTAMTKAMSVSMSRYIKNDSSNVQNVISPISVLHPHPTISPTPIEINRISYDHTSGYLYGAAGDMFGGYIWDLKTSTLLGTLGGRKDGGGGVKQQIRHTDYLHTIKAISSYNSPSSHLVMTGGEDGKVGLWDGKEHKLIDMINCKEGFMKLNETNAGTLSYSDNGSSSSSSSSSSSLFSTSNNSSSWVSSIDVDPSAQWAVIGGGIEYHGSSSSSSNKSKQISKHHDNGFISLMNLPTRTLSTFSTTRESINDVAFHPTQDRIVSVGNNNIVSFWNQLDVSGGRVGRSWSTSPSSYSIAIDPKSDMMAISGIGSYVDCFSNVGTKLSSLSIDMK